MLYMIGLGLADAKDITLKGAEAIQHSDAVFLEGYTSLLQVTTEELEKQHNTNITVLGRDGVEKQAETILEAAKEGNAAFLVVGDVFTATTHTDLYLRAKQEGIDVQVIPNAGIINAVGITGLELYKFGRVTTLVYPEGNYKPTSFYDVIQENNERGLHTLCLLDIKTDENRYMSVSEAITQLQSIEQERGATILVDKKILGCARIATHTQTIKYGLATELVEHNWGAPPHCLIIPGTLHIVEEEMLEQWSK